METWRTRLAGRHVLLGVVKIFDGFHSSICVPTRAWRVFGASCEDARFTSKPGG